MISVHKNINWAKWLRQNIILYPLFQAFDCVDHNKQREILQEMGIPDNLTCLLRNLKQQLQLEMEQQTGSKQEKEYVKAIYCHPA